MRESRQIAEFNLDAVVTSFGGVATTTFIDFLRQKIVTNCPGNSDLYKHTAQPPVSNNPYFRAIYIFGDPTLATISLFNRNFHQHHSQIMQANFGQTSFIHEAQTLDAYLQQGDDRFNFRRHFDLWRNSDCWYPRLILRYEVLWDRLDEIANFLSIPASTFADFPPQQARGSAIDDLPAKTQTALYNLYGSDQAYLASQPDFQILPGKRLRYFTDLRFFPQSHSHLRSIPKSLFRNLKNRR
ncbi:hypothetical protein [Cerasicoccus maritimus]|uniref:hypothetical protein n=1 Tax=Cerasicoccus maritimus TaxID=490089 RepID=UPI002852A767|nr:hypothetical protein [Cerasicoccus maritimus]